MSAEEMKAAQMKRREMLKKINRDKDALKQIRRLGRLLMVLLWCSVILATTGLAAAILVGEMCRFGYIPTQEEESQGILNPYSNPSLGCDNPDYVWLWPRVECVPVLDVALVLVGFEIGSGLNWGERGRNKERGNKKRSDRWGGTKG